MGLLKIIELNEYILSPNDFNIERLSKIKQEKYLDNNFSFLEDLNSGRLNRYKGTFVLYKLGVLCGQSESKEILEAEGSFTLCTPDTAIYRVPKQGEELTFKNLIN